MFRRISYLIVGLTLTGSLAYGQKAPTAPNEYAMYCSGIVTSQPIPRNTYVISGVESSDLVIWKQGQSVFINKGGSQGVKVGDEFLVSRPVKEHLEYPWFQWQDALLHAMGQTYADVGRLRVTAVQANTSVAEIVQSCGYVQRDDILQPFTARPAPPFKAMTKFNPFAPPDGKARAMIVTTKGFGQLVGAGSIVYVNLGSAQGVKVGDYFRIFRYQDAHHETVYQVGGTAYKMYGFGAAPTPYTWSDLPRDVLGEGIVVRTGPNASTVLITLSGREIYAGDYVELE
jgi:hypothetical protein